MLEAPLPAPEVRARDFSDGFGAQLQWMANEQIGHARIRVSPQELGPVEVMLRLDGERISADFVSAHAETRQALEHGLPRLRDLLGEHGFQLAHAGVGQESPGSHDDAAPAMTGGPQPSGEGDEVKGRPAAPPRLRFPRACSTPTPERAGVPAPSADGNPSHERHADCIALRGPRKEHAKWLPQTPAHLPPRSPTSLSWCSLP